jgi:hypothetical protein
MLPPNTATWNLLKRRMLEDGRGVLPTPRETTFPDYELISTTTGAMSRASKNQKSTRSRTPCSVTQVRGNSLVVSLLEPARSRSKRCNTAKVRISTQYPVTQIERSRVSLTGRRCLRSIILSSLQSLLRPCPKSSSIPTPCLYFAPRCHNTTLAVSKRMARSKVKERCLI